MRLPIQNRGAPICFIFTNRSSHPLKPLIIAATGTGACTVITTPHDDMFLAGSNRNSRETQGTGEIENTPGLPIYFERHYTKKSRVHSGFF